MEQLVASMSGVLLGGVVEVVGSNLASSKLFTASISLCIYNSEYLHPFLFLFSAKAMMFVKLCSSTSDMYQISLVSLDPPGFHLRTKYEG